MLHQSAVSILLLEHMLTELKELGRCRCMAGDIVTARGAELARPISKEEEGHSSTHAPHDIDSCVEDDGSMCANVASVSVAADAANIEASLEYAVKQW